MFSFLVAGTLFVTAMGAVLLETSRLGFGASDQAAQGSLERESRDLMDTLLSSPGIGWEQGADQIERLGLGAPGGRGLDPERLEALRESKIDADGQNGKVDYAEAALSLGLDPDDGTQFHIRMHPVGLSTIMTQQSLSGLKTAYLGDWSNLPSVTADYNASMEVIVADADARLNQSAGDWPLHERAVLKVLGLSFRNHVYMEQPSEPDVFVDVAGIEQPITGVVLPEYLRGDVYPDEKNYLDAVFADRLPTYDLLVVGSGVDQSALTTAGTKYAIRDWVLAGGILMVMGSEAQNVQWLRPLFDAGVTTANGGVWAPDTDHPVLKVPDELNWGTYDNHGLAWDIDDKDKDKFTHIVTAGNDPILAVSTDGSFGDGRLFLTTYRPGEVSDQQSIQEATSFLHNMVVYADRSDLYLEYGPGVPGGAEVAAAARVSHIPDELLGQVPVRVEVLTWRS